MSDDNRRDPLLARLQVYGWYPTGMVGTFVPGQPPIVGSSSAEYVLRSEVEALLAAQQEQLDHERKTWKGIKVALIENLNVDQQQIGQLEADVARLTALQLDNHHTIERWRAEAANLRSQGSWMDGCMGRPNNPRKRAELYVKSAEVERCADELAAVLTTRVEQEAETITGRTFRFNVVVLQEGGEWVAQCLDFDVADQGISIEEAKVNLAKTLAKHIVIALHNGEEPFRGIPTAPLPLQEQAHYELRGFTVWRLVEALKGGEKWQPVIADVREVAPLPGAVTSAERTEQLTVADINAINALLEVSADGQLWEQRRRIADLMWKLVFLGQRIENESKLAASLPPPSPAAQMADAAEMLWVVLANVSGGDWTQQSKDWQDAAARWRDNYFAALNAAPPPTEPT